MSQEQVRLIDDQTFETMDVLPLHRYEMACSCTSLTLADDPNPYYVVGTAYAIPDEQEPTKVHPCTCLILSALFLPIHYTTGCQHLVFTSLACSKNKVSASTIQTNAVLI